MELENLDNIFFVNDMTSLRYAVPFIKAVKRLFNKSVVLVYNDEQNTEKYNSIKKWNQRFEEILKENNLMAMKFTSGLSCKSLFCVENASDSIKNTSHYSFQHGFDYINLHKKNDKKTTYLVADKFHKTQIESLGLNAVIQPTPVVFWDWDYTVNFSKSIGYWEEKLVTMFYPEAGSSAIFKSVYDKIIDDGFSVLVKQRAKNQLIPGYIEKRVYDSIWYPTESILLPISSDFSVGFGTSAYTDLVYANRDFVDLSIPDYSQSYYKPESKNFYTTSVNFFDFFCRLNPRQLTMDEKAINICDDKKIADFLQGLIA